MVTAVFVSALLLTSAAPALRVEISSPKTRVSIFEPVKITVRATALQAVAVPGVDTTGYPLLETWIDYGKGYVRYIDSDGTSHGIPASPRSLKAGDRFVETLVLVSGSTDRPTVAFPTPGRFPLRVVARLRSPKTIVLGESSAITFDVVAPEGTDVALLQRIRDRPWVLRGGAYGGVADYAALAAQFPGSPYLDWGKQGIAWSRIHRVSNGRYPDTNEKFAEDGRGHPLTPQLFRELADELRDSDWGQFDEERLQLAAENLERAVAADRALRNRPPAASDFDEANTVWREIVERFPGSEAADAAKSRIPLTPPPTP